VKAWNHYIDTAIFEKLGHGYGEDTYINSLLDIFLYLFLNIVKHLFFSYNVKQISI